MRRIGLAVSALSVVLALHLADAQQAPNIAKIGYLSASTPAASAHLLEDVVALYDRGGVKNPWLSQDIGPLGLSTQEQADLVAFLHALTGQIDPEVGRPPTLPQ